MIYKNPTQAQKETGFSYLGLVNNSTKHEKAWGFNELVYSIYLAPADTSGYEVCPLRSIFCTNLCLNESGQNMMDISNRINQSRIKKTNLYFENREYFVRWVIDEIKSGIKRAEKLGFSFSVRLNNTSDLCPTTFYIIENGKKKNLLDLFPNITFYDYTKVPKRVRLMKKYPNYDVTFSYSGTNMDECIKMLDKEVRVAMVFNKVPDQYLGREVVDGDNYDMRYRDRKDVIVGLKFKKVRNKLEKDNPFVIQI